MTDRQAIILCGGQSSRMGRPKALLDFGGVTMIERVVGAVSEVVTTIVVVRASGQTLPSLTGCTIVEDDHPDGGPLCGLATGWGHLADSNGYTFVCGCDHPFLTGRFLSALLKAGGGVEAITCGGEGPQPLCAWYRHQSLKKVGELVAAGERRLSLVLEGMDQCVVPPADLDIEGAEVAGMGVNTPLSIRQPGRLPVCVEGPTTSHILKAQTYSGGWQ